MIIGTIDQSLGGDGVVADASINAAADLKGKNVAAELNIPARLILQLKLKEAGLDSLPGGGAEVFAERVRQKICHDKCGADRYLDIHRLAHGLGMRSNITMLYGHIETIPERIDHILRTRALQD